MGKHAYRAVYKSIQYTEYRVNTDNCFLWYVRAVLESIFSTQYSKANSVQILQRTVSLGDSTERSVVPAAGCCFLPEGLTPKLHRKLALHIVCCVDPCKHSEALISKPVHAPVQTKPNHSPLYIPDLPLGVWTHCGGRTTAFSTNSALRKYSGANHALESLQNMHSCSIYIQR